MVVVVILLILIILITAILIFGGMNERKETRMEEKEKKLAQKQAKKEIKQKNEEIKKSNSEYVDLFKMVDDENETVKNEVQEENKIETPKSDACFIRCVEPR